MTTASDRSAPRSGVVGAVWNRSAYWLATTNADGSPHVAAVGTLPIDGVLCVISVSPTRPGTPSQQICASWFQWTGGEVVMPTFIQAPHVRAPARRLAALRARPDVAVSIETESTPAQVLMLRGKAQVTEVDGIDPDYAASVRTRASTAGPPRDRTDRLVVRPQVRLPCRLARIVEREPSPPLAT